MTSRIDPSQVLWSASSPDRAGKGLLVLLHGYGSNENELFRRVSPLLRSELVVASVRGPIAEGAGFAWISRQTSLTTLAEDAIRATANEVVGEILEWLDSLMGFSSVGLLGVSQGAVLAVQLLRVAPTRFAYVVNLSGYSLAGDETGDLVLEHLRPPVFWGRGRYDAIVPVSYVERTSRWLPEHSTMTATVYEIGHTQSHAELADAAKFIRATRRQ